MTWVAGVWGARGRGVTVNGDHMRGVACRVQGLAGEVRGIGARMTSAAGVEWHSLAADRFREQLAAEASRTTSAAATVEHAARCLARHAAALDVLRGAPGIGLVLR